MANYLMPTFGIILGFLFFDESLGWRKIGALGLIVSALFLKKFSQNK
jgi:drug/metabolite transporter (DMT)-like permease